jgi:hypothetical protein
MLSVKDVGSVKFVTDGQNLYLLEGVVEALQLKNVETGVVQIVRPEGTAGLTPVSLAVPKVPARSRQPRSTARSKSRDLPTCVYLRGSKYHVVVGSKWVGQFDTVELAVDARDKYKAENPGKKKADTTT